MCCKIDGCKNIGKLHRNGYRYFPRGFCNSHYKKWVKENRSIIEKEKLNICVSCSVVGCESPSPYKKGLCSKHYVRSKKHGDTNFVEKRREGQTTNPLYNTYQGIRKRCLSVKDKDFPQYGGKGIKICDRWSGTDGFFNFIEDMGERPEGHTIDRKDTDGDYEPSNCRWADANTQNLNRSNVIYRGVTFYKKYDKYRVRLTANGVTYEFGMFKELDEAIKVRKQAELKYLGKVLEV